MYHRFQTFRLTKSDNHAERHGNVVQFEIPVVTYIYVTSATLQKYLNEICSHTKKEHGNLCALSNYVTISLR